MKPHHLLAAALFLVAAAGCAVESNSGPTGNADRMVKAIVKQWALEEAESHIVGDAVHLAVLEAAGSPTLAEHSALRPMPKHQPVTAMPRAIIDGPTEAQAGDLVVLDASAQSAGDVFAWVSTDTGNYYVDRSDGKVLLFANRTPGRYNFVLVAASVMEPIEEGGKATVAAVVAKHTVVLTGDDPAPNPNPGPGPTPDPTPEPLPDGKYKLAAAARDWAALVPAAARVRAAALAGGLDALAAQVAAGTLRDMDPALEAQRNANNAALGTDKAAWQPWLERAESRFIELWDAGQMATVQDIAVAWREIANGLRAVK